MDLSLLAALNAERRARRAVIVATRLADGTARLLSEGAVPDGDPLATEAAIRFRSGRSGLVEAAGEPLFLNVHLPPPRLVAVGAVHITQALAPMASIAGLDVTIVDPRTAFAAPERFPGATLIPAWPGDVAAALAFDRFTALAALTHDPKIDEPAIEAALAAGCFYVGALGSRKTHARRVERLTAAGVAPAAIARIAAPIGLDIGAATPAEIAVAVLAEIIAALRGGPRRPTGEAAS
ncbi:XdhC family protein [Segnochrobactrum spirostomi]|uniref:XdhC family protein n=1 Tax=Segnochrobactrum spirostomi TaxID=2608987 RepID=A0A6A7Y2T5_9HYPH|nr:XdhC family protein [Segnochrobactrum spirostomi]MQT12677.1 XdhC family protein [Segnochrobactrum spirostomi]